MLFHFSTSCVMSAGQSGGLSMETGVLYLSHAMLVLAELNEGVCMHPR